LPLALTEGEWGLIATVSAVVGAVLGGMVAGYITYRVTQRQIVSLESEGQKQRNHDAEVRKQDRQFARRADAYVVVTQFVQSIVWYTSRTVSYLEHPEWADLREEPEAPSSGESVDSLATLFLKKETAEAFTAFRRSFGEFRPGMTLITIIMKERDDEDKPSAVADTIQKGDEVRSEGKELEARLSADMKES